MDRYRPSNGTEAEDFRKAFCYRCLKFDPDSGCDIESRAWLYNIDKVGYPDEWVEEGGESRCTKFLGE